MTLFLGAVAVLVAGGVAALLASGRPLALPLGTGSAAAGSLLGLASAWRALSAAPEEASWAWSAPLAALRLGLDPLSALFLAGLFALALPAALYGAWYMARWRTARRLGGYLLFFNLLLASIALVLAARQAVFFLVAWELMAVTSFLLVTFEDEEAEVRRAGLTYLVASHLGTAFLFGLFLLLGREAGSYDFSAFAALSGRPGLPAALIFGLALVGFGTKAGLVPLHVWLPEAHPAAPSPVSALLSGVMIKTGLYGILRVLGFLPAVPASFGLVLAVLGAAGGLAAITLAMGQRDLKRVLAYSSVENVGLVLLGLGAGLVAAAQGAERAAALALAGALLHVWNHALMKGLAFLGAGTLAHAAHTRDLEAMGGLLRRLPATGALFLLSAAALSALPPLNGFLSEWLLYLGLLESARAAPGMAPLLGLLAVAVLAVIGAVAAIAFTRLAGVAVLGSPRSPGATQARQPGPAAWGPLALLAAGCVGTALFPAEALRLCAPAVAQVARLPAERVAALLAPTGAAMALPLRLAVLLLLAAGALLLGWRRRLLAGRPVEASETWGCGYARPTARMQYTASSYAQLVFGSAPRLLAPRGRLVLPRGPFPGRSSLSQEREDPARRHLFDPLFQAVGGQFMALRRFQAGKLHLQLLYTVAALLALALFLAVRGP